MNTCSGIVLKRLSLQHILICVFMVSVPVLFIELSLDVIGFVMGIIVLKKSQDNTLQKAWGILAISLSFLLFCDNMEWVYIFAQKKQITSYYASLPLDHLSLWHIFRTIIFFQIFSLFPIASMHPGWLTRSRILCLCIPLMLILCIILCYHFFNGELTELKSFADIIRYWGHLDVKLRLILFVLSVIAPTCNFLFPFFKKWMPFRRRQSKGMYFYIISFCLIMIGYIWLMLGTCGLIFNLFGCIVVIPAIYMNILYFRNENPLSLPPSPVGKLEVEEIEAIKEIEVSQNVFELSKNIEVLMEKCVPFINPEYSLQNMLDDLDTNENRLNKALRYNGFSGFRDFINFCRLQYFKRQAFLYKNLTVKELMYKSGFTSRSSFYRYFSSVEKVSPTEYLDQLKENK